MKVSRRGESGQSLLEFALVLPVLLLVLMGIIDFGMVFGKWLTVEHAARDAVRYASLGTDQATVKSIAEQEAGYGAVATVSIIPSPENPDRNEVTVQIKKNIQISDPLMGVILGNPYPISSSVTMLVE